MNSQKTVYKTYSTLCHLVIFGWSNRILAGNEPEFTFPELNLLSPNNTIDPNFASSLGLGGLNEAVRSAFPQLTAEGMREALTVRVPGLQQLIDADPTGGVGALG